MDKLKPFIPRPICTLLRPVIAKIIRTSRRREEYQLEIEPEDVFLVSFPRSGNTWMRYMLSLIHPRLGPTDPRNISRVIPSLDTKPDLSQTPRPRVIKSHSPFDPRYPRVIYLLRDGRDATYSFYIYSQKQNGYTGSFYDFLLSKATYHGCRWHEHVESWLSNKHSTRLLRILKKPRKHLNIAQKYMKNGTERRANQNTLLLIRYEEMLADPELQLRRAVDFLGWLVNDEDIKRAVAESRIDKMRAKERSGVFLAHVRQGRTGEWRQHYSDEEIEIIMSFSATTLRRFGYIDT